MAKLITELGYLGFEVSDLPRWEQFASDVLGLGVAPGAAPGTRLLRMDDHRQRFILGEGPADDCVFAGWQVSDAAAVDAFGKHLDGLGVTWAWGSDTEIALRGVQRMLHFADPTGSRHEVYCGPALASDRFCSPKVASGFVTRGEGLGHIVYSSSDYPATLKFAQQVLGLSDSDTIRLVLGPGMAFEVSFLHANTRHHSFALAGQPPTPGPHKRVHHFMIEVGSVEDVGFARDRCLAMGQAVHMDVGQHPNDRMISFYGQTPSGFYVEFGWGGVKVDDATWQVVTYDKLSEWGHRPSGEVAPRPAPSASEPQSQPNSQANSQPKDTSMSASGKWNVVIKTPMGNNDVVFDLQADGSELHGAIVGAKETNEIFDGNAEGNSLRWGAKVSSPIPMTLEFTATIDGNSIFGGAKSPFGTAPFSGTRA